MPSPRQTPLARAGRTHRVSYVSITNHHWLEPVLIWVPAKPITLAKALRTYGHDRWTGPNSAPAATYPVCARSRW